MRMLKLEQVNGHMLYVGSEAVVLAREADHGTVVLTLLVGGNHPYIDIPIRNSLGDLLVQAPRGPGGKAKFVRIRMGAVSEGLREGVLALDHIVTGGQSAKRNVLLMAGGAMVSTPDRIGPMLGRENA
jgi:hypothetical protein